MKIDSVDFFYLAMPEVTTAADGSQDALVVRVSAGGHVGWGECEASPLPSIAAFVCPMSHGACRPVSASVLGETLDGPDDIRRMAATVAYNSMDLLQARAHLVGHRDGAVGRARPRARRAVLEAARLRRAPIPRLPYASVLFGDDAAGDAGARQGDARPRLPRGQVRLGAVRRLARRATSPISTRRARGSAPTASC